MQQIETNAPCPVTAQSVSPTANWPKPNFAKKREETKEALSLNPFADYDPSVKREQPLIKTIRPDAAALTYSRRKLSDYGEPNRYDYSKRLNFPIIL
ncbi:hypothetical protein [Pelagicoccus albus]|uniref:Uncharacterized protein n=1 Tax=Pelagicoccus albus TaxID=415222 RepID=A0A7X1B2M2_9BACT|nr:hypothetical protein [Pelagicoccus albus]MBC2604510.1 hypothetical protein [Pelagicoccus albus]